MQEIVKERKTKPPVSCFDVLMSKTEFEAALASQRASQTEADAQASRRSKQHAASSASHWGLTDTDIDYILIIDIVWDFN